MSCNCTLNETLFIYDVLNNPNDIVFTKNLSDIIPAYNPTFSGLWRPIFWNQRPLDDYGRTWERIKQPSDTGDTIVPPCTGVSTPEGLGIRSFVRIYNPKLRNWIANNFTLDIDWIINFKECQQYTDAVLMWYRYYDIARDPDKRFLKGIDLYLSDGDFATVSGLPQVSDNLQQDAALIKSQLLALGYGDSQADRQSKILATGPQIDWISLNLTNKTPSTIPPYNRNEYGQMIPFLSGMSLKKYTDIGKNNFITTKIDLVRKLAEKNGVQLSVPESTEASLVSKFTSRTGANIGISLGGSLYRYNKRFSSGYDLSAIVGDLEFKAARTNETYVPPPHISFEFVNGEWTQIEKPSRPHHVNNISLNDNIIGFNLSHAETGVFAPNFEQIKFHGLGGVSVVGGVSLGESCANAVSLDPSGDPIYTNSVPIEGPYFLQNYIPFNPGNLEQPSQPIVINIKTQLNSLYRLDEKISIKYLRSDNRPDCEPFVSSSTCDCFPLKRLYPDASGRPSLDNSSHLLNTPNTSLFYIPTGAFYAGLSGQKVAEYGITLPNHPSPLTPFPKIHKNFFPMDSDCTYSMDGCGNKTFYYDFPYPGKIQLNYQSPSGNFKMSWNDTNIENPPPKFATTAGSICLDKTSADPSQVILQIQVPADAPDTSWAYSISGTQDNYSAIARLVGLGIQGNKGFFHPNFGWTFNSKYYNKSPLIPFHKGLFYKKKFNSNLGGYRISLRYGHEESSGSPCWGGHVCNRAKFDIIVNDVYIGLANLNNSGGPEDPGPEGTYDRTSTFTIPSSVQLREGNRVDILIKCAYADGCHGGIAWVQITNNRGQLVFDQCIGTEETVTLLLAEPENNYFYNSYAMYDEEYLPGYNYIFNTSGLSDIQREIFQNAAYVGIKVPGGNSYYIAEEWNLTHYTPSESLILDQVPFEYINMDYTYGYAYNDFVYEKIGDNKIKVVSITNNDDNRPANYVDHPSFKQTQLKLYQFNDVDKTQIVNVVQASGNTFTLSANLNEGFEKGFLFKNRDNQSVIVYRPYVTEHDPHIDIGKWGNMSYGDAFFEASKYFKEDSLTKLRRYNNSSLRTGISKNTSLSWASPIKFINNYNFDNGKRHYFPVSRLFEEWSNGGRVLHTLGYENQYSEPVPQQSGDRIIASGSIDNTVGYLYCGSYIGPLELAVTLNDNNAKKGNIKVFHNDVQIANKSIAVKTNNNILVNFNKQSEQPIYLRVELEDLSGQCFGLANSEFSDLAIKQYKVTVNQSNAQLRNKSRISYYAHKPTDPNALKLKSFAAGYPNQELIIDKIKASPIAINEKYLEEERTKDFSPFLDLHIFSASDVDMPITQQSGYVFFEDFFQPKPYKYIASGMEVPYDPNKYWINLDFNKNWNILTSKGILLESKKRYKILKKLDYHCSGDAEECAKRYPKNICDIDYDLTIQDVFDILGMSGNDINLFDIRTIKMPQDCDTIDYCCDTIEDPWQKQQCLFNQQYSREQCRDTWEDEEYKTSCIDTVCPTGNITGVIGPTAEYFVLQLKDKIKPNVLSDNQASFYFFGSSDTLNIPCTNLSFPTIGSTFLYNYECTVNNACEYIVLPDYTISNNYVPGEMLDLSPLIINEQNGIPKPVPSSVIFANEEKYRSIVPHDRIISPPLYEYDPLAESRYNITHTFDIKSKKCVGAGGLFSLGIDDWSCTFSIESRPSGLVLKSCFDDVLLKSKNNVSTITVNGQLVDGTFTCGSTPTTFGMVSCGQAEDYIPEDAELIDCKELSTDEDYTYSCQYCGPSCGSYSISYDEAMPEQCFCPGWLNLEKQNGFNVCTGQYDNWFCDVQGDCTNGYQGQVKNNPFQGVITVPTCFAELKGANQQQLDGYNNYCPEMPAKFWKETVTKTYRYENLTIFEEPNHPQYSALTKANVEKIAEIQADMGNISCANNECFNNCAKILDPDQLAACQCNCTKTFYNNYYDALSSLELTVACIDVCGESDNIILQWFGGSCGFGTWWWWGWDCLHSSSSWSEAPSACGPSVGCGYKSCSDIQKRLTPYVLTYDYDCKDGFINEQKSPIKVNEEKVITQRFSHKQRKVTTTTKTKTPDNKALYDPSSEFIEKVKVYNKSFQIQYKNKDEQECSDQDKEKECCDKVDLNISIRAEIFQNIMNMTLFVGSSSIGNICINRNTSNLFKCPVITYSRSNTDIYICDNVTSQCTNCNIGKLS